MGYLALTVKESTIVFIIHAGYMANATIQLMGLPAYVKMGGWGKIVLRWTIAMVGRVDNMGDVKTTSITLLAYATKVSLGSSAIKLITVFRIRAETMELAYQILVVIYAIAQRFGQDKTVVIEMSVS